MSAAASEPVISFEGVRLAFGDGDVLRDLTFQVAAGESKVLIGETGSGKTMTLKMAAGLVKPLGGRVRVLGHEISAMREVELLQFRREIGFVFQEGALFDSLSVADNVAYRLREDGAPEEEIEARVREALRFVEMEKAIDKLPDELSGGMRRRVSIARALVDRPEIVLYDSPTAGLDPITSQTIISLIMRLRDTQGVTSLLATHRLQDAFGLANYRFDADSNRVVRDPPGNGAGAKRPATNFLVLRQGKVYFEGGTQEILGSRDEYLRRFLV